MLTPEQQNLRGLRIVNQLSCNYMCSFCYQQDKRKLFTKLEDVEKQLECFPEKHFLYATIMGGESTLLGRSLEWYIDLADKYATSIRLTTNGSLLTPDLLKAYKKAGLTGLNISIASLEKYGGVTGTKYDKDFILEKVALSRKYFPDVRINIPLCKENCEGTEPELARLIAYFVGELGMNITICEDIKGTYKGFVIEEVETRGFGKMVVCHANKCMAGCGFVEDTGYGLIIFEYLPKHKRFGYYTHKDNYKNTDLVVTPLGTWTSWDNYCELVK